MDDGRWLTKRELGEARGISPASADKLARRRKWTRRVGNDKTVRILVPMDWLSDSLEDTPRDSPRDGRQVAELKSKLEAIEAQLIEVREDRDRWHAQAEQLAQALAKLETPTRERKRWWPFRKRRQREEAAQQES